MGPARLAFALSVLAAVFAYGVAVGVYRIFPYRILAFGLDSARDVWAARTEILGIRPEQLIGPARHAGDGVTRHEEGRASPGLTLVVGFLGDVNELRLIELDGTVVQRWSVSFSDVFPNPTHIPEDEVPASDWNWHLHGALALPDGSVVFNISPYGMVKLDRCGALEWTVSQMTHHSIEPASDGGFWVPGRRRVEVATDFPRLYPPYTNDLVLKVSPDGEIVMEKSVLRLLFDGGLRALWLANGQRSVRSVPSDELVHLNDVEELPAELAPAFPLFEAGDIMLSLRNLNLILVLEPGSGEVRWHQTGPWIRQHDPDFLPDGRISVYDNNADDTDEPMSGGSRIIEMDPVTREWTVRYGGTSGQRWYSNHQGKHQPLDNGNVLITETLAGRIFEVDPEGEVVWELIARYDEDEIGYLTQATRYAPDYFDVTDWSCP